MIVLGNIVDIVAHAGEATDANIVYRQASGQVRSTALVVAPIAAAIAGYCAARAALRRAR